MIKKSPVGSSDEAEAELLSALAPAERTVHIIGRPVPLLKRVLREPLSPSDAHIGRTFPTLEYRVSPVAVNRFQNLCRAWRKHSGDAPPQYVPPAFFADDGQQAVGIAFARSGRLHKSHTVESLGLIPVGAVVRARSHIADRIDKKNSTTIVIECTVSVVEANSERAAVRTCATLLL